MTPKIKRQKEVEREEREGRGASSSSIVLVPNRKAREERVLMKLLKDYKDSAGTPTDRQGKEGEKAEEEERDFNNLAQKAIRKATEKICWKCEGKRGRVWCWECGEWECEECARTMGTVKGPLKEGENQVNGCGKCEILTQASKAWKELRGAKQKRKEEGSERSGGAASSHEVRGEETVEERAERYAYYCKKEEERGEEDGWSEETKQLEKQRFKKAAEQACWKCERRWVGKIWCYGRQQWECEECARRKRGGREQLESDVSWCEACGEPNEGRKIWEGRGGMWNKYKERKETASGGRERLWRIKRIEEGENGGLWVEEAEVTRPEEMLTEEELFRLYQRLEETEEEDEGEEGKREEGRKEEKENSGWWIRIGKGKWEKGRCEWCDGTDWEEQEEDARGEWQICGRCGEKMDNKDRRTRMWRCTRCRVECKGGIESAKGVKKGQAEERRDWEQAKGRGRRKEEG